MAKNIVGDGVLCIDRSQVLLGNYLENSIAKYFFHQKWIHECQKFTFTYLYHVDISCWRCILNLFMNRYPHEWRCIFCWTCGYSRYSLERWGQDLQSLDRWVRPTDWIELGSHGLVPWRVKVVHLWEIWSNEPSDTYLDIASRCLWWYVSCGMLPPCSQGDDKADVWWVWGNFLECNFCICLLFQHA